LDSATTKTDIDWSGLVREIRSRLFITQVEIAARCGVAQQTVSAWKTGKRAPGMYARRKLLELGVEAGLVLSQAEATPGTTTLLETRPAWKTSSGSMSVEVRDLLVMFDALSVEARKEVLEFVRYKLRREREGEGAV